MRIQRLPVADARVLGECIYKVQTQLAPVSGAVFKQALRVRAYNRTPFVQTFLWWANVATRVHEGYQSFFPPDVYYVASHHYARKLQQAEARIDYFATSLPTMLLFEDDLQFRQETTALFLQAQAQLGLDRHARAKSLLATVLRRDPNHAAARRTCCEKRGGAAGIHQRLRIVAAWGEIVW